MNYVYVIDSIMGSGKTSAAINKMNEDKENNYIFITPFLREVDRIKESCINRKFIEPENKGKGKLDNLHYLVGEGFNIASTHALFKTYNDYTKELLKNNNYILILDEVFSVLEMIPLHRDDIELMLKNFAYVDDDNFVVWTDDSYEGKKFWEIKLMAKNRTLMLIDNILMLWNFPADIFNSFKEVFILTYMFDAQIQKYYYDINNIRMNYLGIKNKDGYYIFSECEDILPDYVKTLKDKIHILDDDKINLIGSTETALSVSWFERDAKKRKKPLIKKLKDNLINVFNNKYKSKSEDNMWTTYKDYKSKLSGKGYTKGFVSVNARATNDFREKKYLAYCANIFLNPYLKNYFIGKGIKVLEDKYALSELIQWVWRSAIRDDKEIHIYIPSSRMRNLLIDWLEEISKFEYYNKLQI
jgi:hypothetical protein